MESKKVSIKQYVISLAYIGNDEVTRYIDGKKIDYAIMPYWETEGYCRALETEGYVRAYDLDVLLEDVINTREAYELAQKLYDEAVPHALIKHSKEEK